MAIKDQYREDSLTIDISVTENGVPKNITGATVLGAVKSPQGDITGAPGVVGSVEDGPNGIARIVVSKDIMNVQGTWLAQCRVELGVESKTVFSDIVEVGPSIIVDAP